MANNFVRLAYAVVGEKYDTSKMSWNEVLEKFNEMNRTEKGSDKQTTSNSESSNNKTKQTLQSDNNSSSSQSGRYTGDRAKFNDLYDLFNMYGDKIYSGRYNDRINDKFMSELKNLDISSYGIQRVWDDVSKYPPKTAEDFIDIVVNIQNRGIYRNDAHTMISKEDLQEQLKNVEENMRRAENRLSMNKQYFEAFGYNREEEENRYYESEKEAKVIKQLLNNYKE